MSWELISSFKQVGLVSSTANYFIIEPNLSSFRRCCFASSISSENQGIICRTENVLFLPRACFAHSRMSSARQFWSMALIFLKDIVLCMAIWSGIKECTDVMYIMSSWRDTAMSDMTIPVVDEICRGQEVNKPFCDSIFIAIQANIKNGTRYTSVLGNSC